MSAHAAPPPVILAPLRMPPSSSCACVCESVVGAWVVLLSSAQVCSYCALVCVRVVQTAGLDARSASVYVRMRACASMCVCVCTFVWVRARRHCWPKLKLPTAACRGSLPCGLGRPSCPMADFLEDLLDGSAPEPDAPDGSAQDGPAQQRLDLGVCKRAPGGGPTALRGRRRQAMQPGPGGRLQRGSAAAKKQHILMTIGKLRTVDNIDNAGCRCAFG